MRREGPIRVLIADDQELVRSCIRDALRSRKEIQVIGEAKNGDEAIIFCKRNRPDVVLLDICMPKKNGIDATKEILHECESIRIVAISGFIRPDLVRNAIKAGAIGFISKNITDSQLLASILVDACFGRPFFSSDATQVLIDSGKKSERQEPVPRLEFCHSSPHLSTCRAQWS
jgi:DNA-binding NarL/FixJ family response regulator